MRKDYHNLYLKCHVSLSADVFKNWCLENYGLCLTGYLIAPPLYWDAICSIINFKLDLILDVDMYLFFEKRNDRWRFLYLTKMQQYKQ